MRNVDLMVGDLVTFKDCQNDEKPVIVKVMELHRYDDLILASIDGDKFYDELELDDEIVGIPLTEKILTKNGFRWDGSGQQEMMFMTPHNDKGIRYNLYVGLKHKTINVYSTFPELKSPNWRKHNRVDLEVCGPYVHELQHCFQMCGIIDKEIVL